MKVSNFVVTALVLGFAALQGRKHSTRRKAIAPKPFRRHGTTCRKALTCLSCVLLLKKQTGKVSKPNVVRKCWVCPMLEDHDLFGAWFSLIPTLRATDEDKFFNFLRMTPAAFDRLLALVSPHLQKFSKRECIGPGERLAITLRYLASGDSHVSLMYLFRVSTQCIGKIVFETTTIIWRELKKTVFPAMTTDLWLKVASEFETMWNIPHCMGAIDGKHVAVQAFPHCGSRFYCYKGFHSLILMAVSDAKQRFVAIDFGGSGRRGDANVFNNCPLGKKLKNRKICAPPPCPADGVTGDLPYVFIGDAAFQGIEGIVTPFPGRFLPKEENLFNYRLSRARRVVENAFGVLCARYRILRTSIIASQTLVKSIVTCCLALHNFHLMDEDSIPPKSRKYKPYGYDDYVRDDGTYVFGRWRQECRKTEFAILQNLRRQTSRTCTRTNSHFSSDEVMEKFLEYFVRNPVPWQWRKM